MDEITIVRKRSRVWPIILTLLILALIVLAVVWLMGAEPNVNMGFNDVIEFGRRSTSGIT
jgi:hypothetical protein